MEQGAACSVERGSVERGWGDWGGDESMLSQKVQGVKERDVQHL